LTDFESRTLKQPGEQQIGTAAAAFDFGAFMRLCFPAYWAFNRLAARAKLAD
jgi:hypothetical protein